MAINILFEDNDFHLKCERMTCNDLKSNCLHFVDNVGTGAQIFKDITGIYGEKTANLKTLTNQSNIILTQNIDDINIDTDDNFKVDGLRAKNGSQIIFNNDIRADNEIFLPNIGDSGIANTKVLTVDDITKQVSYQSIIQSGYYIMEYDGISPVDALPNRFYKPMFGGSAIINTDNYDIGDSVMFSTDGNPLTVTFTGAQPVFITNSYFGGGGPSPSFTLINATLELMCVFDTGQIYFHIIRCQQNQIGLTVDSSITQNGLKICAINQLNNIPNVNLTTPVTNDVLSYDDGTKKWINNAPLINAGQASVATFGYSFSLTIMNQLYSLATGTVTPWNLTTNTTDWDMPALGIIRFIKTGISNRLVKTAFMISYKGSDAVTDHEFTFLLNGVDVSMGIKQRSTANDQIITLEFMHPINTNETLEFQVKSLNTAGSSITINNTVINSMFLN